MSYDWKNVLISPEDTLKKALIAIDTEALRVALVVDTMQSLLGVVTDGDIRRGLLKGLNLESPVSEVMNTSPLTVAEGTSAHKIQSLMKQHGILAVPIVSEGIVIGLETIQKVGTTKIKRNPVFIMAGGFGTRLRPLTDNCPKPMLKVGSKPLLENLIDNFIRQGFCNFYISTHYMPDQITGHFGDGSSKGVQITYVHEEEPLGTGGALGLLPPTVVDSPLIMINGDILTNIDFEKLIHFHDEHGGCATMCVREYEWQIPYGVIQSDGARITEMQEKPIQSYYVNAGIYVIAPSVFKNVKYNLKIDMPTLLQNKMDIGLDVMIYPIHEYWLDIGRMDDFERAQRDILKLESYE